MSILTDRLRSKGGVGCQCGAWYYGECCCATADWPEQFISQAADVLDAIDRLHQPVAVQPHGVDVELCDECCQPWECATHLLLHPEAAS